MSKEIIKGGRYNIKDIAESKAIPWATSWNTLIKLVKKDIAKYHVLNPVVIKAGKNNTRYSIKGENIIKFVNLVETNKIKL